MNLRCPRCQRVDGHDERILFHPIYELRPRDEARVWAIEVRFCEPDWGGSALEPRTVERQPALRAAWDRFALGATLDAAAMVPGHPALALKVHASTIGWDRDFPAFLLEAVSAHKCEAGQIILEVTSPGHDWDTGLFLHTLAFLRDHGFRIGLDDLGVGQGNLQLLLATRPDVIRLAGSLVRRSHADYYRWALVECSQVLATRLGATLLAEGVDDPADLAAVRAVDIRLMQGAVFSRPMTAAEASDVNLPRRGQRVLSGRALEAA